MSNLSHQFDEQKRIVEDQQRRRYARKREWGYVGTGFWLWNYPNMVGTVGAGTITQTQPTDDKDDLGQNTGQTASDSTGMGEGGTAASATGAAGGSPA
jgi:hypothetical protein